MPSYSGDLRKMRTSYAEPVRYELALHGGEVLPISDWVGSPLRLHHTGEIYCKRCGRKTSKSFAQGFCYPCFRDAPENSPCIIKPELCEGHLGIGRDPEWEQANHVKPHVVYLAVSSGLKVGVTRADQVPTRWIDQGAYKAIILAEVPYRRIAGELEVALKEHLSDKTAWQAMLKNNISDELDLAEQKARVGELVPPEFREYLSDSHQIWKFTYPVLEYPEKVKSINLTKVSEVAGTLMGIKGQYLIFDEGRVLNIRSHAGFRVEIEHPA